MKRKGVRKWRKRGGESRVSERVSGEREGMKECGEKGSDKVGRDREEVRERGERESGESKSRERVRVGREGVR